MDPVYIAECKLANVCLYCERSLDDYSTVIDGLDQWRLAGYNQSAIKGYCFKCWKTGAEIDPLSPLPSREFLKKD